MINVLYTMELMFPETIHKVYCFDVISWFKNLAINRVEVGGEAGGRNEVDCSGLAGGSQKMLAQ